MRVTVPISFDDEIDRELLRRLRAEPRRTRSAVVRQALAEHYRMTVTLADIYRKIEAIAERGAAAIRKPEMEASDEPEDLATALDSLGT